MKLSKTAKTMILVIGVSSLAFIVAATIYYRSFAVLPFAIGAILGAALNALKVIMLERTVEKAVDMDGKDAKNYIHLQYIFRFVLTGILLAIAAVTPFISLWGAAAGIFTLQIATLSAKSIIKRDESRDGKV